MKKNRGLQSLDPIQSNPWMDPIHVQLWLAPVWPGWKV